MYIHIYVYMYRYIYINMLARSTSTGAQGPSVSAYITYARKEDAAAAIHAVDGELLDGRVLRCVWVKWGVVGWGGV